MKKGICSVTGIVTVMFLLALGTGTAFADEHPVDLVLYPDDPIEDYEARTEGSDGSGGGALRIDFINIVCGILPWLIKVT